MAAAVQCLGDGRRFPLPTVLQRSKRNNDTMTRIIDDVMHHHTPLEARQKILALV